MCVRAGGKNEIRRKTHETKGRTDRRLFCGGLILKATRASASGGWGSRRRVRDSGGVVDRRIFRDLARRFGRFFLFFRLFNDGLVYSATRRTHLLHNN